MPQSPAGFVPDGFEPDAAPETPVPSGAVSRFVGGAARTLASSLDPRPLLKAAVPPQLAAAVGATDPETYGTAAAYEGLVASSARNFEKAIDAFKRGDYGPAFHRAVAGVIPPYSVVPEAADKLRAGDVAGGLGEAVGVGLVPTAARGVARGTVGAVRAVPGTMRAVRSAVTPEMAAGLVKHGTTAALAAAGGPAGAIVGSELGANLAARLKARLAPVKAPSGRLVKSSAPPLTDQLHAVLDELHKDPSGGPLAAPVAGATPGGEQAATASMRMLAEKPALAQRFGRTMSQEDASPIYRATNFTKPTTVKVPLSKIVATQEGFQDPIIEQYRVHPGSELPSASQVGDEHILMDGHHRVLAAAANGETTIELNTHPVDPALAANPQPRAMWLETRGGRQVTAPQARMMERTGRSMPYQSESGAGRSTPIPLSEAMTAVRQATTRAKVKLTATEFDAAQRLVREGRPAADVLDALAAIKALKASPSFAQLPTDAEMAADLEPRGPLGGRSRRTAAAPGNPFR